MIRLVKSFSGTRDNPSFTVAIEQFDSVKNEWVKIPEIWISKEDERKYNDAMNVIYCLRNR